MAPKTISRKAATSKGFLRRVHDAGLDEIDDPRQDAWVVHPLAPVLKLAVLALASNARSARAVENRSVQLRPTVRADIELKKRVSDNAFGLVLPRVDWCELRRAIHRQVKAEWRRGNLDPCRFDKSTVAIDGKHLATLPEKRLRALITQRTELDGQALSADELRRVMRTQMPYVQLQESDQGPLVGLISAHRATLISAGAAVTVDQWPIQGKTNEWGTIEMTLGALFSAYGRTNIVERVTLDSGNATPEVAEQLIERSVDYFMAVKTPQGKLHKHVVDRLGVLGGNKAEYRSVVEERGKMICYSVWREQLDDERGFAGAQQVFRIERVVADDEQAAVGNRYFVSSEQADELDAQAALKLARAHWRCENEGHWTADAVFDEDARRTPWTTHPDGVLVVGLLRALAINILAVLRALSRIKRGNKWATPTWKTVIEQALLVLCEPLLDMEAFNALEA
jgi:hypothetical protein